MTRWDWGYPATLRARRSRTDKRNPTVNANGMIYGADFGTDNLLHGRSGQELGVRHQAAGA